MASLASLAEIGLSTRFEVTEIDPSTQSEMAEIDTSIRPEISEMKVVYPELACDVFAGYKML